MYGDYETTDSMNEVMCMQNEAEIIKDANG